MQVMDELTRRHALLDLFRNKEELVKYVKIRGILGNGHHETVVIKILR